MKIDFRFVEGIFCCSDDFDYYIHAETIVEDFDLDYSNQLKNLEDKRFYKNNISAPIGFFGSAVCLFMVPLFESIFIIIFLICITNLFSGAAAGGFGVNHADIGPNSTGTLVGVASTFGMIAGVIGNAVSGLILEITNSWTLIFHIAASLIVVGGLIYLLFASDQKQFD